MLDSLSEPNIPRVVWERSSGELVSLRHARARAPGRRHRPATREHAPLAGRIARPAILAAMRVIAGQLGGQPLTAPRGRETRPTSDRVREALFSILGPLDGLHVLDLFAGSGALAIEALSRGARGATLVDSSRAAITAIAANLDRLGLKAEVRRLTARAFLDQARVAARQYDLVFVDPPYRQATALGAELSTALPPVLAPDARVVAESDKRAPLVLELPLGQERRYGDTLIRIYDSR